MNELDKTLTEFTGKEFRKFFGGGKLQVSRGSIKLSAVQMPWNL